MKILWFEVTEPSAYKTGGAPIGGWQDSLERIVRTIPDINLTIAFVSSDSSEVKVIDGVTYVPIFYKASRYKRIFEKPWDSFVKNVIPAAIRIVNEYTPDLIHIFGTEWPYGQIASNTEIPVIIHIMGAIVPYNNAGYPPRYSYSELILKSFFNPNKLYKLWWNNRFNKNRELQERKTWAAVQNFMGRTNWDESLSRILHPGRRYYHVDEALRIDFMGNDRQWKNSDEGMLRLVSTGITSYWKGPDMMLKVANILRMLNIKYEWNVIGSINTLIKEEVEHKEGLRFRDLNINILGFKQASEMIDILCSSTIYVHTAYIENSPNSICEAQCLGVPVVSSNVGGISTLVNDKDDGVLVPANDPWQMADAIIQLSANRSLMIQYSERAREKALKRHNDENIKKQLLNCYNSLLSINTLK